MHGNEVLANRFATNVYRFGLEVGSPRAHFLDVYYGRVGELGQANRFDCHCAADRRIERPEHNAHRAASQFADDFVSTDLLYHAMSF